MRNSKLFRVLEVLDDYEWKEFAVFMSINVRTSSKLYQFFYFIYKRNNKLNSNKFAIDEIRTTLFGFRSEKYIRNLMSQLLNYLERYLILNEFKYQKEDQKLYLFNALNKRGLYDLANNYADKLRIEWSDSKIKDQKIICRLLQLNHDHYLSNNPIKSSKNIDLLSDLIVAYNSYSLVLSEYYRFIILNVANYQNKKVLSLSLNDYGILFNDQNNILVTFRYLIKIIDQDAEAFNYLYKELCSSNHQYSGEISTIVYIKCRDFIYKKISAGYLEYTEEFIDLIDLGISRGYLLYQGKLSSLLFYNIFSTACSLGKVVWALKYLEDYINLIPKEEIVPVKNLTKAELNFSNYNYLKAIIQLNELEVFNMLMKFKQRMMLLCSYYVTYEDYSFIDSQINSYNQFFYYNKTSFSEKNYEGGLNLGKIIRQLVTGVPEDKVISQIQSLDRLAFRLRLPTIIEQRKIYVKKHGLN